MIVRFDSTALNSPDAWHQLSGIFELFVNGRHQWCVPELPLLLQSPWYRSLGLHARQRVATLADKARPVFRARGSSPAIVVGTFVAGQTCAVGEWWLGPKAALDVLKQPLRILLENVKTDGAFVRAVLLFFGEKKLRRKLGQDEWQRVHQGWSTDSNGDGDFFLTVHGGGGSLGDGLAREWSTHPSGIVAVVDSDHPTPPKAHAPLPGTTWESAAKAASSVKTPGPENWRPRVFALPRREIENYVPMPALRAQYSKNRRALEKHGQLTASHRAHYDLKQGLKNSLMKDTAATSRQKPAEWHWKTEAERDFWSSVDADALVALHDGYGKDVWQCWQLDHSVINRRSLESEAGREFDQLVDAVLELL